MSGNTPILLVVILWVVLTINSSLGNLQVVSSSTFQRPIIALTHKLGDFTNYFLAFPRGFGKDTGSLSQEEKAKLLARREGVLELCHNWGTGKLLPRPLP